MSGCAPAKECAIGLRTSWTRSNDLASARSLPVPDGWLGEILVRIEHEPTMRLVRATHEEEALAIACGLRLGGVRTAILVQNAGVLSMGAGMVLPRPALPVSALMLVSYRGTAGGSRCSIMCRRAG